MSRWTDGQMDENGKVTRGKKGTAKKKEKLNILKLSFTVVSAMGKTVSRVSIVKPCVLFSVFL